MDNGQEDVSDLPGVLADIARLAGREAALDLVLKLGGSDFYIPKTLARLPEHPLTGALGPVAAAKVAERFGGCEIYIPRALRALALHLAGQGFTTSAIASTLGCSRSAVRRYIRAAQGTIVP